MAARSSSSGTSSARPVPPERSHGLPSATVARRFQTPSWRDTRLLVGVLLVLVSVVAGAVVVDRADRTVPVYAAARVLGANALNAGTSPTRDLVLWFMTFMTATLPFALLWQIETPFLNTKWL